MTDEPGRRSARRRLKILSPEVLPLPPPREGPAGPRERTAQHLRRLLALAAAGTALQAGCSRPQPGAPDAGQGSEPLSPASSAPSAPPASSAAAAGDAGASSDASAREAGAGPDGGADDGGDGEAGAGADGGKRKVQQSTGPGHGYRVVDPMPTPFRGRDDPFSP